MNLTREELIYLSLLVFNFFFGFLNISYVNIAVKDKPGITMPTNNPFVLYLYFVLCSTFLFTLLCLSKLFISLYCNPTYITFVRLSSYLRYGDKVTKMNSGSNWHSNGFTSGTVLVTIDEGLCVIKRI